MIVGPDFNEKLGTFSDISIAWEDAIAFAMENISECFNKDKFNLVFTDEEHRGFQINIRPRIETEDKVEIQNAG